MQTPLMVQWCSGMPVGIFKNIKKLVEWPVVAKTPLLSPVLYTGQL